MASLLLSVVMTAGAAEPVYHTATTRKILQLTGDLDRPLQRPTKSQTKTRAGLTATDLGSSFEHKGNLCFLFGDSFCSGGVSNADCMATSSATNPRDLILNFPLGNNGVVRPIVIPGISQGAMEVPSYGISLDGIIYIVHTTDWHEPGAAGTGNMERSVLARSDDDGKTWPLVYDLSAASNHDMTNTHFINAALSEVGAADWPGLPFSSGKVVLIWGSGAYRKSDAYLACIPSSEIENKTRMRYFAGLDAQNAPVWASSESQATPLFTHACIGEISAAWIAPVGRWAVFYNAGSPRGITMRTAARPWGPYSPGQIIMEPWNDDAYGRYMHVSWDWKHLDAFHDSGQANNWGGEYGPYIIPRFTEGNATRCRIYYAMSTWNPYQAIMMRSEIGQPLRPDELKMETRTETLRLMPGGVNWNMTSADFFTTFTQGSTPYITTYTEKGDAATGMMWLQLPRDELNRSLSFSVHGGKAEVLLIEGGADIPVNPTSIATLYTDIKAGVYGDVAQCAWGHSDNAISVPVNWNLRPFDSASLKIVIIDRLTSEWGFISVSQMALTRASLQSAIGETWPLY
ncbi:MAG: DUF4185 domain-containing protein [Candidatus Sumerlaeota bacterium]|nr:DUF4185 domain-containing protein [Candidatus Sumerlaeota bacterium]